MILFNFFFFENISILFLHCFMVVIFGHFYLDFGYKYYNFMFVVHVVTKGHYTCIYIYIRQSTSMCRNVSPEVYNFRPRQRHCGARLSAGFHPPPYFFFMDKFMNDKLRTLIFQSATRPPPPSTYTEQPGIRARTTEKNNFNIVAYIFSAPHSVLDAFFWRFFFFFCLTRNRYGTQMYNDWHC